MPFKIDTSQPINPQGGSQGEPHLSVSGKFSGHDVHQQGMDALPTEMSKQEQTAGLQNARIHSSFQTFIDLLSLPGEGIEFIAKAIGNELQNLVLRIQLAIGGIFGYSVVLDNSEKTGVETSEEPSEVLDVLKQNSEKTGLQAAKELLKGSATDVGQFEKDFDRGSYLWNKLQINSRAIPDLKDHFTENGFKNMSFLFVQSLCADITENFNAIYNVNLDVDNPSSFGVPARINYEIHEEEGKVKLTIDYIFTLASTTEELDKVYSNFFKVKREITLSKEDFQKDWSQTNVSKIAPSLEIKDTYSKDITVEEAAERFKESQGKDEIIINGEQIIAREIER